MASLRISRGNYHLLDQHAMSHVFRIFILSFISPSGVDLIRANPSARIPMTQGQEYLLIARRQGNLE